MALIGDSILKIVKEKTMAAIKVTRTSLSTINNSSHKRLDIMLIRHTISNSNIMRTCVEQIHMHMLNGINNISVARCHYQQRIEVENRAANPYIQGEVHQKTTIGM